MGGDGGSRKLNLTNEELKQYVDIGKIQKVTVEHNFTGKGFKVIEGERNEHVVHRRNLVHVFPI